MISKELLSEVLGTEYKKIEGQITLLHDGRIIDYNYSHSATGYGFRQINIHELAHKCKEWAMSKGYELKSSKPIVQDDEGRQVFNYYWMAWLFEFDGGFDAPLQVLLSSFVGNTEPEAIFKACQWILDNKEYINE